MPDTTKLFLMLIKVHPTVKSNPQLLDWINEIDADYMERFGELGASLAHIVIEEEWDFALVFPGSEESVAYLSNQIHQRAPGQVDILTLRGTNLDDLRGVQA